MLVVKACEARAPPDRIADRPVSQIDFSMLPISAKSDSDWLLKAAEALRHEGCAVVSDVLPEATIESAREAMYRTQEAIHAEIGEQRLEAAGEIGVLRIPALYDQAFLDLLTLPEMLAIVDRVLGDTAILHLQNGFVLPPRGGADTKGFQHSFHRDFPRHLHGYVASLNVMLVLDEFTERNGGTLVVPGTHQRPEQPAEEYLQAAAIAVECPVGSMILFDSTLWHAAGPNRSENDRLAINHQFTRAFFKQQIDYVRALGDERVLAQPARTQQLLGWYTRVVTSLDEYYRPSAERLYRSGQG
jgi:ectoine hydroxylase-related dioxygenase (phytanoyl-CoA dioxygenase family)